MRFRPLALLTALAVSPGVFAGDLYQLYEQARQHDASYLAAAKARDAGVEKREQGKSLLRPNVAFVAESDYRSVKPDVAPSSTTGLVTSLSVQARQTLYGDKQVQSDQAEAGARVAEVQYQVEEQSLILRVAQAYFEVLEAQDAVEVVEAQKAATSQQLAQAKKSFEVGTATITDTHEAQARYDLIVAQEIAVRNDLAVKQNALRQLTGSEPESLVPMADPVDLDAMQPDGLEAWLGRTNSSLSVQLRELAAQVARRDVDRAEFAQGPTLDAVAAVNRTLDSEGVSNAGARDGSATSWSLGVQLNWPIYSGGGLSSRSREAVALSEQAQQNTEVARRETEQQIRQAHLGVTSGLARVHALEAALRSSKSSLDSITLGRQVGVRTNLDVLNAQQQYYSARKDLAAARYDYILAQLRLESAAGSLDTADLQRVNALLKH